MGEVSNENTEPVEENSSEFSMVSDNDEVALESERRKSTMSEIKALRNSEC